MRVITAVCLQHSPTSHQTAACRMRRMKSIMSWLVWFVVSRAPLVLLAGTWRLKSTDAMESSVCKPDASTIQIPCFTNTCKVGLLLNSASFQQETASCYPDISRITKCLDANLSHRYEIWVAQLHKRLAITLDNQRRYGPRSHRGIGLCFDSSAIPNWGAKRTVSRTAKPQNSICLFEIIAVTSESNNISHP